MSDPSKHAERQATEDLLAGFDRPGRSPRAPAVRAQVDFQAAAPLVAAETVLVTRKRGSQWPWLVLCFVASAVIGVGVLVFVLRRSAPAPGPVAAPAASEVAAPSTIASIAPEPVVAAPAAPSASTSVRRPTSPAAKKPEPPKHEQHRDDFIKDL